MKKYLYLSAAALALASCSSDEFLGNDPGSEAKETGATIAFGSEALNATRADNLTGKSAAEKLNNNFIVYGFKYYTTEPISATDVVDATKQQTVFDLYNVNYTEGSDKTTESNTKGWEYVGYTPHTGSTATEQSIKYWDYSATGYVFSAVSGTGITATKTTNGATVYDKGWQVTIPAGGDLSTLYASNRVPVAKTDYQQDVTLTFYSLATKIRFGLYETVPGYSIQIKKVYYNNNGGSTTNFGVDGKFKMLSTSTDAVLNVTYYDNQTAIENRPKVTVTTPADAADYGEFGANVQATEKLNTASNNPTWDQANGEYTYILPYNNTAGMSLKVDYTLTSTDGSKETINVYGATAKVPANFTNWKENFAYTYLFKISDNTNGYTGSTSDPAGLYPITFDAVVVNAEDGIQETITSVSDPSITTYQNGVVVTKFNEYEAGDIYFEEGNLSDIDGYKVYEVNNLTDNSFETQATMTEEVVANYLNNFCVLTEVDKKDVSTLDPAGVPLSDGTYITKAAKKAYVFKAEAGKTYVICDEATPTKHYKLIKVQGGYSAPNFTLSSVSLGGAAADQTIDAIDGEVTLYLSEAITANTAANTGVIGATPSFQITSTNGNKALKIVPATPAVDGSYTVSVDADAINAGKANDTYTVSIGGKNVSITVDIATALYNTSDAALSVASVTAGDATGVTAVLKIADATSNTGVIVNAYEDKGVNVINTSTAGKYTISADQDAVPGVYDVTIAGETVAVTVTNYAFTPTAYTYNMNTNGDLIESATKVVLKKTEGAAAAAEATGVSSVTIDAATGLTLTGTDGVFTATATVGGTYNLSYQNTAAEATVTVNKYAIEGGTIARSTGRVELGVTVNGDAVNASAAKVKITKDADSSDQTANFTITTNGQKVVLSGAKSTLATGAYTVHYYLETGKTNEVATSVLTVN